MCLQLHATHVDPAVFESVKERYYRLLMENPFFTTKEKDRIGRFIADRPLKDIEAQLRPFAGLKTLIVERDMNCPMPEFRAALAPVLR